MTTHSEPPDIQADLKGVIERALQQDYEARSSPDGPITGNSYQSVVLGDTTRAGFRSDRHEFLDRLDLRGKSTRPGLEPWGVGPCRPAARGGHRRRLPVRRLFRRYRQPRECVQPYVASLLFPARYRGSIELRRAVRHQLAFSVFTFIRPVLDVIAERTKHALVIETHKLGQPRKRLSAPRPKHFP